MDVDVAEGQTVEIQFKVRQKSAEAGTDKPATEDPQSRRPPTYYPANIDAAAVGKKALEKYDANKDGKISGAELDKAPALKAAMATMRTNKDKGVTADDIAPRIKAWQATKVARIGGLFLRDNPRWQTRRRRR